MRRLRKSLAAAVQRLAVILIVTAGTASIAPSRGADPQPYTVNLKPTGDTALDAALNGSSTLISLQKSAPVGGFALTERARQDADRFATALQSFGYYKATVTHGHRRPCPQTIRRCPRSSIRRRPTHRWRSLYRSTWAPLQIGFCYHFHPGAGRYCRANWAWSQASQPWRPKCWPPKGACWMRSGRTAIRWPRCQCRSPPCIRTRI